MKDKLRVGWGNERKFKAETWSKPGKHVKRMTWADFQEQFGWVSRRGGRRKNG